MPARTGAHLVHPPLDMLGVLSSSEPMTEVMSAFVVGAHVDGPVRRRDDGLADTRARLRLVSLFHF